MELEGFKRVIKKFSKSGLVVGKLVTDRHRQLAKYVRENVPAITHMYDVWHIAKGIKTLYYSHECLHVAQCVHHSIVEDEVIDVMTLYKAISFTVATAF